MHAMTAAHRTLPLGSIVRVTNLKTGHTALVRITDRGPFIPGRVLDLSLAAARKARCLPARSRGSESGSDADARRRSKLAGNGRCRSAASLTKTPPRTSPTTSRRRYHTAKVLRFTSPAGDWWVRVRVLDDDRQRAQQLAAETETPEGAVFLVRLD